MHKHYSRGFTIVELLIIAVVIIIITTVITVTYTQVQLQSRDSRRSYDMTMIIAALENFYNQNGEYPPGCPDPTCPNTLHTANTSSVPLTSTTTLTTLTSVLPGIRDRFGDPQSSNRTYPFKNRTINEKKYIYFGGTYNNTTSTLTLDSPSDVNFPCTLRSSLAAGAVGSYVIGYFHEETNKWMLLGGRNATQITIAAGSASDGCVINR